MKKDKLETLKFDPSQCLNDSILTFRAEVPEHIQRYPGLLFTLDNRYIKDVTSSDGDVLARIDTEIDQLLTLSTNKKIEKLEDYRAEYSDSYDMFYVSISNHAREIGVSRNLTQKDAEAGLKHFDVRGFDFNEESEPKWNIYYTRENSTPVLVGTKLDSSGNYQLEAVDFDELHAQDPNFLPEAIKNFRLKEALGMLGLQAINGLDSHSILDQDIFPETILRLIQISNKDEREKEIDGLQSFLVWMRHTQTYSQRKIDNYTKQLTKQFQFPTSTHIPPRSYCEHKSFCTTETAKSRVMYSDIYSFINSVSYLDHLKANVEAMHKKLGSRMMRILENPGLYINYLSEDTVLVLQQRCDSLQTVCSFIDEVKNLSGYAAIVGSIPEKLPDLANEIRDYRKWLGNDMFGNSNFDKLISEVAFQVSVGTNEGKMTPKKLNELIDNQTSSLLRERSGLYSSFDRKRIADSSFEPILHILVVKKIEEKEHYKGYKKMEDICSQITAGAVRRAQSKLNSAKKDQDIYVEELEQRSNDLHAFQLIFGISNEEISHLNEITEHSSRDLLDVLFNCLFLEKIGAISLKSPLLISALKNLFPEARYESVWDAYNKLAIMP